MFLAIEIHCTPPDVQAALGPMLEKICKEVREIRGLANLKFGIQLDADNSPHKLGDTIWVDAQFRGEGSRDLPWQLLDLTNATLFDAVKGLVDSQINRPARLRRNPSFVPCEYLECNTTVQGVGHWAETEREIKLTDEVKEIMAARQD